ncbi:FAD-dependent monooxygenase [Micromonospora sp. NPDC049900]|uniref:FAD-dependent monooxygenase n=1 Tax=unclassified Micromonospora TaxID=2617518 RepID=UPI0037B405F0
MGTRRVAIIGAGPAGLFLGRLLGLAMRATVVDVYERAAPGGAGGFGITLSDRTMRQLAAGDRTVAEQIGRAARPLSGIELRLPGRRLRYDGFPVVTVSRTSLLAVLTEQARQVGVRVHHGCDVDADDLDADVVVLADGARSANRAARSATFGTTVRTGLARFIWLGTDADLGDAATMFFVPTEYGSMAAHAYSCGGGPSTVVVEMDEGTWRRAGLHQPGHGGAVPGELGETGLALLDGVFAERLGGALIGDRRRWSRFSVVTNRRWSHGNQVLIGDAAHTAHFTVASGTSMALADALALAAALRNRDTVAEALAGYERQRRPAAVRMQRLAGPSMRWWETYGRRMHLPAAQFGLHFITRTTALSYLGLRRRCPVPLDAAEAVFRQSAAGASAAPNPVGSVTIGSDRAGAPASPPSPSGRNAVAEPFTDHGLRLAHRLLGVGPSRPGCTSVGGPHPMPAGWLQPCHVAARSPGPGWDAGIEGRLLAPGRRALRFVVVAVTDPWADDETLRELSGHQRRGVDGVLLLPGEPGWWDRATELGGRVRTELGLVVAGCVPADWSSDLCRSAAVDAWPARIHLALVSARLDLVAQLPQSAADLAAPTVSDET